MSEEVAAFTQRASPFLSPRPGKTARERRCFVFFGDGTKKFSRDGLLCGSGQDPDRARRLSGLSFATGTWRGMALHRAFLLLFRILLGSFVPGALCGSPSHSLSYFYLRPSEPSQGLPQFSIRGYLDNQPITRFDSLTGKMEPLVPWMEDGEKERFLAPEWVFKADLEKLSKLDHQVGGLHTWQMNLGCELREDGSKGGFLHYGYDGMDFISFDKETLRWVAAQPQAQKVKEKWEEDPRWFQGSKVFLEETCIERLQRYLSYKNKTLEEIEPPVGKVTHKVVDERLEILTCQAFGFYPKEIQATWTRDGEPCVYETLLRNVAPNSDGTYYVQLSIDIDPKERDRFRCHLEHEGLQEPLDLSLKEETAAMRWIPIGFVAASVLLLGILFLIYQRTRPWKKIHCKSTTWPDQVSPENLPSPTIYGTEDESQSQAMLQPKVSSEVSQTLLEQNSALGKYMEEKTIRLVEWGNPLPQSKSFQEGNWQPMKIAQEGCHMGESGRSHHHPRGRILYQLKPPYSLQGKPQHEATTRGGQRPEGAPEDTVSTLPNGEWKQFISAVAAADAGRCCCFFRH